MRLKLALIGFTALSAAAVSLPASAQSYGPGYDAYGQRCENVRRNNQAAGAVLGAVIGGVLGSNIARRGHRGDGTAVGAGLGALTGGAAGRSTTCAPPPPRYGYGPGPYPATANAEPYPDYPPPDDGALAGAPGSSSDDYPPDASVYDRDDRAPLRHRRDRLYANGTDTYKYQDDSAGRDCTTVNQVTRLPDGSSIRRPVEVCREAHYGGWEVQN
ncbi:MAG: hypothetical protein ABI740_03630 [Alphaproteobacteria bacterium]